MTRYANILLKTKRCVGSGSKQFFGYNPDRIWNVKVTNVTFS